MNLKQERLRIAALMFPEVFRRFQHKEYIDARSMAQEALKFADALIAEAQKPKGAETK